MQLNTRGLAGGASPSDPMRAKTAELEGVMGQGSGHEGVSDHSTCSAVWAMVQPDGL
ncbi:hypothetical protein MHH60_24020 [Paenibacillus sp. FSL H7-0716]|uniref:hypothetical protein n=1 Tax=Paenibacillus odorifer TaxID=189426 RepID=UPI00155AF674|nr:hypothetical protein [Paenibacillus odorifer]